MRWFTSDHHFGHRSILDYGSRPFRDVTAMRDYLVAAWNEDVEADDEVWVLGNFALGRVQQSVNVLKRLNGRKVLVPGEHDRCWPGHAEPAFHELYLDAGFDAIVSEPVHLGIAGRTVRLSHFPFRGSGDHGETDGRFPGFWPVDDGGWLLHGHVQTRWRARGRQVNVGVDAWAGHLVSEQRVEQFLLSPAELNLRPYRWPRWAGMTADERSVYDQQVRASTRRQLREAFGVRP